MKRASAMLTLIAGLGCAGLMTPGPEDVVEDYLRAASRDDQARVKALVEDRCDDTKVGRGGPARMLGGPITIDDLEVTLLEKTDSTATVHYRFSGSIDHEGGETKTKVFGSDVTVKTGPVSGDIDEKSGTLDLVFTPDGWKVTCLGVFGI